MKNILIKKTSLYKINPFIIYEVLLIFITSILYLDYLLGNKYFIFKDISFDSYSETYPHLIYWANNVKNIDDWISWNWFNGLGNITQYKRINIFNIFILFGKENIAYFLGVFQALKVILAGTFFYKYLKAVGRSDFSCYIGGIGYAFCAHMMVRQGWMYYPNEVVVVALWLWCFELYFTNKKRIWLPLSTAFLFSSLSGYHVCLYIGIMIVYCVFRIFWEEVSIEDGKHIMKYTIYSVLCGFLISSIYSLPDIFAGFSSERILTEKAFHIGTLFQLNSAKSLASGFFRTLGNNLLGILDYKGDQNLLDDPCFYVGLLNIIILSQIKSFLNKRRKVIAIICLSVCMIYILFPQIASILSAFTGKYKLSSFWITLLMLYLATECLDLIRRNGLNAWNYWVVFGGLILGSIFFGFALDNQVNYYHLGVNLVFGFAYGCILYKNLQKPPFIYKALVVLFIFEIFINAYEVINIRETVGSEELHSSGYADDTSIALNYLEQYDSSSLYRVDKKYNSVSLQDAIAQGYMGTKEYEGGAGNNYLKKFAEVFDFPQSVGKRVFFGTGDSTEINTLLGVKYILTRENSINNLGYEYVDKIENINIYQNKYPLGIGLFFENITSEKELEKMSMQKKRAALLKTCFVDEGNIKNVESINLSIKNEESPGHDIEFTFEENISGNILSENLFFEGLEDNILYLSFDAAKTNDDDSSGTIIGYDNNRNLQYYTSMRISEEENTYEYLLNAEGITQLEIVIPEYKNISNIKLKTVSTKEYYKNYTEDVNKILETPFNISYFSNSEVQGIIENNVDGVLVLATAYNQGWHCLIDGKEQKVFPADIALVGVEVPAGAHDIRFYYKLPYYYTYIFLMSIGGLLLIADIFMVIHGKRNRVETEELR